MFCEHHTIIPLSLFVVFNKYLNLALFQWPSLQTHQISSSKEAPAWTETKARRSVETFEEIQEGLCFQFVYDMSVNLLTQSKLSSNHPYAIFNYLCTNLQKILAFIISFIILLQAATALEKPACIKTHLRDMLILPEMVGNVIGIYNGKQFNQVEIKVSILLYIVFLYQDGYENSNAISLII